MANQPPPVPPAGRSSKGRGAQHGKTGDKAAAAREAQNRKGPDDADASDRPDDPDQDNIKQNTVNQGYKQAR
jgi:hypothetical protein